MKKFILLILFLCISNKVFSNSLVDNCKSEFKKNFQGTNTYLNEKNKILNTINNLDTEYNNLINQYNFEEAKKIGSELYQLLIFYYGYCDPETDIFRINYISDIFTLRYKHNEAIDFYLKEKKIIKELLGDNNKYYLDRLSQLSTLYNLVGEYENALIYSEQAYKTSLNLFGEFDFETINEIYWYASALNNIGDFSKANEVLNKYEKYLYNLFYINKKNDLPEWRIDYLKEYHFSLIELKIDNYRDFNYIDDARDECHYHLDLSKREQSIGFHYERIFYNCKDIFYYFKNYELFVEVLNSSKKEFEAKDDEIHVYINILKDFHYFYHSNMQYDIAYPFAKEALELSIKNYPITSWYLVDLFHFDRFHETFIKVNKNEILFEKLLKLESEWNKLKINYESEETLKNDYYNLIDIIGNSYLESKQFKFSYKYYNKLLNLSKNLFSLNSNQTANAYSNLAIISFLISDYTKSSKYFSKQYEILINIDADQETIINNLLMHSGAKASIGDYEGQKEILKERLNRAKTLGTEHEDYVNALIGYSELLYRRPETREEADKNFQEIFDLLIYKFKKGKINYMGSNYTNDLLIATSLLEFSTLYEHKGQYSRAIKIQKTIIDQFLNLESTDSVLVGNMLLSLYIVKLCENYIEIGDYQNALKYLKYAKKYSDKSSLATLVIYFSEIKINSYQSKFEDALNSIEETKQYINEFEDLYCDSNLDECGINRYLWGLSNYEEMINIDIILSKFLMVDEINQSGRNQIKKSLRILKNNFEDRDNFGEIDLSIKKHMEDLIVSSIYLMDNSINNAKDAFIKYINAEIDYRNNIKINFDYFEMDESTMSKNELNLPYQVGYNILNKLSNNEKNIFLEKLFILTQLTENRKLSSVIEKTAIRSKALDKNLKNKIKEKNDKIFEIQDLSQKISQQMQNKIFATKNDFSKLTEKINILTKEIDQIDTSIKLSHPNFANFSLPSLINISEIQDVLNDNEAIIKYIFNNDHQLYAWLIKKNKIEFYHLDIEKDNLIKLISKIRSTLDINTFQEFAINENKSLYNLIFKKLEKNLYDIENIFVILDNPIDSIPLDILCNECKQKSQGDYSEIDFLIKKFNFTYYPDFNSFIQIQKLTTKSIAKKLLIGFGNPNLNTKDNQFEESDEELMAQMLNSKENITRSSLFGTEKINSKYIFNLYEPLPETETELKTIANYLNVNENNLYFGDEANEENIKSLDLTDYQIIYFATHGEVAGKFNNNQEPFLILTPPNQPDNLNDGLLTASEIMSLNMDANWVVLSACNTATGIEPGAEGLTGLARSFFYAGTRSILVTHWEVETNAALFITTETFKNLANNDNLKKSESLRNAKLKYLNNAEFPWQTHPVIWSPFVIVGQN